MKKFLLPVFLISVAGAAFFFVNKMVQKSNRTADLNSSATEIKSEENESESREEKAYTAEQRWQWEYDMLKDPLTGLIPETAVRMSRIQAEEALAYEVDRNDNNITITARGPSNFGGRTRAIGFDARNTSIMLAGGVSSGMFRSTNGGGTWTKVSSNNEIHNATALAQDPTAQDTWYYGTGEREGNTATLGALYAGHGVWKSTDNGQTWTVLGSTQLSYTSFDSQFDFTNRIVVDPTNGDVYAAASDVIMKSENGGTSWTQVLGTFNNNNMTDIVITSTGRLYAAFDGGDDSEGVWTSTDGGSGTWTQIAGGGVGTSHANWNASGDYERVVLAVAPSNEDKVFALYYNEFVSSCPPGGTAGVEAELFVWSQSGNAWTDLSANLPDESGCLSGNDPFACQGGYDLCIAVKPNDENTVFIGGTNAYRSTDGFTSTSNTDRIGGYESAANYNQYDNHHPDIQILTFAPGNNDDIYSGTDGGIARADITVAVNSVTWTELNTNYITYQYYHVDIDPTDGSTAVMGGAQDNGTTIIPSGTTAAEAAGADGVSVGAINITDADNYTIIAGFQNGRIFRIVRSGGTLTAFDDIQPTSAGNGIFVTYFYLDQDNTDILYYVSDDKLYRTRIASMIDAKTVTGNPDNGWEEMTGVAATLGANIRSMAACRNEAHGKVAYGASDSDRRLYIGDASGNVYRLDDPAFGNEGNNPINLGLGGSGIVSGISVQADDQNTVMATLSNYSTNSCFHTTDGNVGSPTWINVEGNISAQSFRSCAIVKGTAKTIYFVGTENGLYCTETLNGGSTTWSIVGSSSIGFAVCSSMRFRPGDHNLVLGTHGNGMFQLDVSGAVLPVELVSFIGTAEDKGNRLTWQTASEINNDRFILEHSTDGIRFDEIGSVAGAGDSYEIQDYEFLHKTPNPGLNYYRLSQKDYDGEGQIFEIEVVERPLDVAISIEPNPVRETLNFRMEYPSGGDGSVNVYSLTGQLVFTRKTFIDEGLRQYTFDLSQIPNGNYILEIQIGRERLTEKFVKN